jgi:uncharacterized alkaline shock family protein YloU
METKSEGLGELKITQEAIHSIAAKITLEVEGVAGFATGLLEGFTEMVGKRNPNKGVRIEIKNQTVSLDLHVIIYFGYRIPVVARLIQKSVKNAIEEMTEFHVLAVNVLVQGIDFNQAAANPQNDLADTTVIEEDLSH